MIHRSKAPLRLGLAGGGTDVSPFSEQYGGAVMNATVSMYAYASIEEIDAARVEIVAEDKEERFAVDWTEELPIDGVLSLQKGVHNRLVRDGVVPKGQGYRLTTFVEAPSGSGLGTSSTLVVAILGAYTEWLSLPLGEYDTAHLAYEIEREDLAMPGGKQDQYAATFGGFNFMEFGDDKVIVNPLRVKSHLANELCHNLLLFYTDTSRDSGHIIAEQQAHVRENDHDAIAATQSLKQQAVMMKEALLTGRVDRIGDILDFGWENKKRLASKVTNPLVEELYAAAKGAGALGGKISGAGGGGFMVFYTPGDARFDVIRALQDLGARQQIYQFSESGLSTWTTSGTTR